MLIHVFFLEMVLVVISYMLLLFVYLFISIILSFFLFCIIFSGNICILMYVCMYVFSSVVYFYIRWHGEIETPCSEDGSTCSETYWSMLDLIWPYQDGIWTSSCFVICYTYNVFGLKTTCNVLREKISLTLTNYSKNSIK